MAKQRNKASKADVQSTRQNQLPVAHEADTEFSAEQAATAFKQNQNAGGAMKNQQ